MRYTAIAGAVAVAAVLVLAGCSASQDETVAPSPSASSSGPTLPDLESLAPAPSDATPDDGVQPGRHEAATWDDASRAVVVDAADKAMRAFARPDLDQAAWWAGVEPLLTTQAQQDYAYVVPANIPVRKVTGTATLVDASSAYLGRVEVPTDVGTYTVILTRADGSSPWLVSRFTPPEGVH